MAKTRAGVPQTPRKRVPKVEDNGDVHLIYKIQGKANEVDVFELGRVLDSIGNVISETNRLLKKPDTAASAAPVADATTKITLHPQDAPFLHDPICNRNGCRRNPFRGGVSS